MNADQTLIKEAADLARREIPALHSRRMLAGLPAVSDGAVDGAARLMAGARQKGVRLKSQDAVAIASFAMDGDGADRRIETVRAKVGAHADASRRHLAQRLAEYAERLADAAGTEAGRGDVFNASCHLKEAHDALAAIDSLLEHRDTTKALSVIASMEKVKSRLRERGYPPGPYAEEGRNDMRDGTFADSTIAGMAQSLMRDNPGLSAASAVDMARASVGMPRTPPGTDAAARARSEPSRGGVSFAAPVDGSDTPARSQEIIYSARSLIAGDHAMSASEAVDKARADAGLSRPAVDSGPVLDKWGRPVSGSLAGYVADLRQRRGMIG